MNQEAGVFSCPVPKSKERSDLLEFGSALLFYSIRDSNERAAIRAEAAFCLTDQEFGSAPCLLTISKSGCLKSASPCVLHHDRGPTIREEILVGAVFEMNRHDRLEIRSTSDFRVGGLEGGNRAAEVSDCFRGRRFDR